MSYGALAPVAAVKAIYHDGLHHLDEPLQLAFLKNIAGGLQLSLAGFVALVVAGGCPAIHEANPGIVRFIEGALLSTGLITIYFTGGELFTGYPMWLAITALQRKRRPMQYVVTVVNSLIGNFIGALLASALFSFCSRTLHEEPWRSYVIDRVDTAITNSEFHIIFIKAIATGYLVTLAMLLGTQNMDGISKALSLWLPFTLIASCQFPHTVEFMHMGPTGMLLGAKLSPAQFVWKCMLPIILGNTVGGSVFNGAYHWWVYLQCNNGEKSNPETFADVEQEYRDESD